MTCCDKLANVDRCLCSLLFTSSTRSGTWNDDIPVSELLLWVWTLNCVKCCKCNKRYLLTTVL